MCIDLSDYPPSDGLLGDFHLGIAISHAVMNTQVGTLFARFSSSSIRIASEKGGEVLEFLKNSG